MKSNKKFSKIANLFAAIQETKQMNELFELFFTQSERNFLETRYSIIEELLKGELTQREIAKKLNVSIAKITAGSKAIRNMPSFIQKFF